MLVKESLEAVGGANPLGCNPIKGLNRKQEEVNCKWPTSILPKLGRSLTIPT
ncbi:MAG: hypothetical protein N3F10_05075 [Candidatus Bathyarchaeota archaeon]|nr:hypothetical protein [Candidatus Bathyarchaeota archaeon]